MVSVLTLLGPGRIDRLSKLQKLSVRDLEIEKDDSDSASGADDENKKAYHSALSRAN